MAEEIIGFNREDADGLLEILDNQDGQPKKRGKQPRGYIPIPRTDQYVRVTSTSTNTDIGVASYPGVRLDHNARANTWSDQDVIYVLFANGVTPTSTSTRYHAKVTGVHPTNGRLIYAAYDVGSSSTAFSGAYLYNSGSQSITTATNTAVTWDTEQFDTDSYHSTSSNTERLIAPGNGIYEVGSCVIFDSNSTGVRQVALLYTGGLSLVQKDTYLNTLAVTGGFGTALTISRTLRLQSAEYVTVSVHQTSGGNLNISAHSAWIYKVATYP